MKTMHRKKWDLVPVTITTIKNMLAKGIPISRICELYHVSEKTFYRHFNADGSLVAAEGREPTSHSENSTK